ncbi:MAG: enolase C-terminal domain-like protein [Pseudomonadota bacterium]
MKIAKVEALRIKAPEWRPQDALATAPTDALFDFGEGLRRASMCTYNMVADARRDPVFIVIVRVTTTDGISGVGGVALGSEAVARVVENQLAPLVEGCSPFDTELLWEKMYRSTVNIGRTGLVLEAISGVDIAIWDVIGKALGQPVYNLLGGKTRERIRAYCSAGRTIDDVEEMGRTAAERKERYGLTAFKMWFGYGPTDGREGMRKNYECIRALREALGPDTELMADAYMGWDVPYAIEMINMLEPFNLKWIEEPLLPDNIEGYARIRDRVGTPISGGEHEFTRWGFRRLIEAKAVDFLQPDVNRCGGVTEARKIWALAQAHDLPVIPHSHNFHNQHLIMASLNSPLSEWFPSEYRDGDTFFSELFKGEAEVVDGHITLSDKPGFGIELNQDAVDEFLIQPQS